MSLVSLGTVISLYKTIKNHLPGLLACRQLHSLPVPAFDDSSFVDGMNVSLIDYYDGPCRHWAYVVNADADGMNAE